MVPWGGHSAVACVAGVATCPVSLHISFAKVDTPVARSVPVNAVQREPEEEKGPSARAILCS